MKRIASFVSFLIGLVLVSAQTKEVKLKFIETSDIHGNYFPYNFITKESWSGSLARVYSFVEKEREKYKENLLLLDNGDILQGQPTAYYYNFIDTVSTHIAADIMNFMKYDAGNMGNHDVEAGHSVYDRWISACDFPVLGANIVYSSDGSNYLKPYQVFIRDSVKIVVLGMITPAIPTWLPERLWEGLSFEDMEETARKWMKFIRTEEKPDLVVGLFHSGRDAIRVAGLYNENASEEVAQKVPGFDIVFMGHDHLRSCYKVANVEGDSVLIIDPANNGKVVADVEVTLKWKDGALENKEITGVLTPVESYGVSGEFMQRFNSQYETVENFVSKKIGTFAESISTEPAYFGPSAFIDLIHTLQLALTNADVSFAAPLSFRSEIKKGDITVGDLFNLYKYENMLYVMELSGKEIRNFLEMSYAMWTNQMKSPHDHLLLFKEAFGEDERQTFKNYSFNFDSAAGIIYTVDVTKPQGRKVHVVSMADGTPFEESRLYKVALNSYRGNGGGELLTKGAGIPQDNLAGRIIFSTHRDLRYYLMEYIENRGMINPIPLYQWKFIPEDWVVPAAKRDYKLLFGGKE